MTKAQDFLSSKGLFNTKKLINIFDEVLLLTDLLEEYKTLDKPDVIDSLTFEDLIKIVNAFTDFTISEEMVKEEIEMLYLP